MSQNEAERKININRGSIDSLSFYEVTEDELSVLENGSASSEYLNVMIALISIAISFFATIFTVDFKTPVVFVVFLVIAISTLIGSIGFCIAWRKSRKSHISVISKIKARMKSDEDLTKKLEAPSIVITPGVQI
jgi:uncharacterized protein YacL